jgi:large subunit ribosomal protein L15
MLNELHPPKDARKDRKRKGQGVGTGNGKTAGRGHKGQKARKSGHVRRGFEGGQMPLIQRLAKRGFHNKFRTEYQVVNIGDLTEFSAGSKIDKEALVAVGLVRNKRGLVKLLGAGELKVALSVEVDRASKSAQAAVEAAGGSVTVSS